MAVQKLQAVVIGEKVYIGGGLIDKEFIENALQVFQYDPTVDEWNHLPLHHVVDFAMAQFMGHLITVGGVIPYCNSFTGKVYHFRGGSRD